MSERSQGSNPFENPPSGQSGQQKPVRGSREPQNIFQQFAGLGLASDRARLESILARRDTYLSQHREIWRQGGVVSFDKFEELSFTDRVAQAKYPDLVEQHDEQDEEKYRMVSLPPFRPRAVAEAATQPAARKTPISPYEMMGSLPVTETPVSHKPASAPKNAKQGESPAPNKAGESKPEQANSTPQARPEQGTLASTPTQPVPRGTSSPTVAQPQVSHGWQRAPNAQNARGGASAGRRGHQQESGRGGRQNAEGTNAQQRHQRKQSVRRGNGQLPQSNDNSRRERRGRRGRPQNMGPDTNNQGQSTNTGGSGRSQNMGPDTNNQGQSGFQSGPNANTEGRFQTGAYAYQPQHGFQSGTHTYTGGSGGFQNASTGGSGFQSGPIANTGGLGFQSWPNANTGGSGFQSWPNVNTGGSGFQSWPNADTGGSGFQSGPNANTGVSGGFQSGPGQNTGGSGRRKKNKAPSGTLANITRTLRSVPEPHGETKMHDAKPSAPTAGSAGNDSGKLPAGVSFLEAELQKEAERFAKFSELHQKSVSQTKKLNADSAAVKDVLERGGDEGHAAL